VNLDNAASTPAFRTVTDTIERFLPYYSSVHRGTGYLSRVSTAAYEQARERVGRFVGADPERDAVVFGKNTTEAINKLARSLRMAPGSVVLTTLLEHHSNDLPWRVRTETVHVRAWPDGTLDEDDLDRRLAEHRGRVALLVVSGASNVTGLMQPVHRLAEKVHAAGGRILVDAAQLLAHRPFDMRRHDDPGHIDFVALSAHKLYAPFGTGALVGRRDAFAAEPDHRGGGTIYAAHEAHLTRYAVERLERVPGLTLHGPADAVAGGVVDKVGVVPFTIAGVPHGLVAAVLGYEHGVGVRSGCFCAQPYIVHLLRVTPDAARRWIDNAKLGDIRDTPGMVRISLGCYNDTADIDRAVDALEALVAGEVQGRYRCDDQGTYTPEGYTEPRLFSLDAPW